MKILKILFGLPALLITFPFIVGAKILVVAGDYIFGLMNAFIEWIDIDENKPEPPK